MKKFMSSLFIIGTAAVLFQALMSPQALESNLGAGAAGGSSLAELDSAECLSECDDCLAAAASECLEVDEICLKTSQCVDWIDCISDCDFEEDEKGCYLECDASHPVSGFITVDLFECVCDMCDSDCQDLCR